MPGLFYKLCLLYTRDNSKRFAIVGFQTDNILFLSDKTFAIKENEQLYKANLLAKIKEKLGKKTIKFNDDCITHKSRLIHFI